MRNNQALKHEEETMRGHPGKRLSSEDDETVRLMARRQGRQYQGSLGSQWGRPWKGRCHVDTLGGHPLREIRGPLCYPCHRSLRSIPGVVLAPPVVRKRPLHRWRGSGCRLRDGNCITSALFSTSDKNRIFCNLRISAQRSLVPCLRRTCLPPPSISCRS